MTERLVHDRMPEDEDDAALVRKMLRYKSDAEVKSWTELSIQDVAGEVHMRQELGAEADADLTPSM